MTRAPYLLPARAGASGSGHGRVLDHMIHEGLTDAFHDIHMGVTAENLVERYGISRADQDAFAAESQARAVAAIADGGLQGRDRPGRRVPAKKGETTTFDTDEHPRAGTTAESLGKLKPAFKDGGTVTAGNASGLNDGAAALVIASASAAERLRACADRPHRVLRVGRRRSAVMGIGPVPACARRSRSGLARRPDRPFELNEAFAAQSLAVLRELGWTRRRST